MMTPRMPINKIGEENWIEKLTDFLAEYDVDVENLDFTSKYQLPFDMELYYKNFGGIESSDYMYNLYTPDKFIEIENSDWEFINEYFSGIEKNRFIVFGESPANDPLCLDLKTEEIYLFSHDPIKQEKVFENFTQYLKYEIIETQKLLGDIECDKSEELEYHQEFLGGSNIDYKFRLMKFC